jgi:cytochrome P450
VEWARKWPDAPFIRHLSWGNSETLIINNVEACRQVLQLHAYSFVKPEYWSKIISEFLGRGVLFSVGDEHRRLRRVIAGMILRT